MNDDADERLIKPPVVIENYGSLDGKSRTRPSPRNGTGQETVVGFQISPAPQLGRLSSSSRRPFSVRKPHAALAESSGMNPAAKSSHTKLLERPRKNT